MGREILVEGIGHSVVGILAPAVRFPFEQTGYWVCVGRDGRPGPGRHTGTWKLFGRLAPDRTGSLRSRREIVIELEPPAAGTAPKTAD